MKWPFISTVKESAYRLYKCILYKFVYCTNVGMSLLYGSVSFVARLHRSRNQVLEEGMTTPTILPFVPLTEYVLPILYIFKTYVIECSVLWGIGNTSVILQGYKKNSPLFVVLFPEEDLVGK